MQSRSGGTTQSVSVTPAHSATKANPRIMGHKLPSLEQLRRDLAAQTRSARGLATVVAGTATIAKSASIHNGEVCADPVEQTAQLLAARNRRSGAGTGQLLGNVL